MATSERSHSWLGRAECGPNSGTDPDIWSEDSNSSKGLAIHICRMHCRALIECREFSKPQRGMVVAGVAYNDVYECRPMVHQPVMSARCYKCLPNS